MKFISTTKLFLAITLIGFSFTSLAVVRSPAFYDFEYIVATSISDNSTRMATLDASQNSESDKAVMAVPPNGECPEGWKQAAPPLNPQLGCIPTTMSSGPNVDPSTGDSQNSESDKAVMAVPPNGECPEGWKQAAPPLNPQLGCIPTTMSSGPNVDPSTGDSQNSESDKAVMAVPPESEKSAD